MRDPHVDSITYRMECSPTTSFKDPPPLEIETSTFLMLLQEGSLKFELKDHHATLEDAQSSVAPFLRAWEIDVGLNASPGEIRFVYENCGISDRNPQRPGEQLIIGARGIASGESFAVGVVRTERSAYPEPPTEFRVTPTVETLWQRYEGYIAGREPLSSMAYFCLTVLESSEGRKAASKHYGISFDVLRKLGELTASRGNPMNARKMGDNLLPHSLQETRWIEAVVRAIIRRAAEIAAGAAVNPIGMTDLPPHT